MAWLTTSLLAALVSLALGRTHKTIGGGRQTALMAIFGLLPFEGFVALLTIDDGSDGLLELSVFAPQCITQGCVLSSQLFEFFTLRHAATLAD